MSSADVAALGPHIAGFAARFAIFDQLLEAATTLEQRSQVRRLRALLTVAAVDHGWSYRQLADLLSIEVRSVEWWHRQARTSEPGPPVDIPDPPIEPT